MQQGAKEPGTTTLVHQVISSTQAEKHRGLTGSDASVLLIVLKELAPIRRLPTIEDAP